VLRNLLPLRRQTQRRLTRRSPVRRMMTTTRMLMMMTMMMSPRQRRELRKLRPKLPQRSPQENPLPRRVNDSHLIRFDLNPSIK